MLPLISARFMDLRGFTPANCSYTVHSKVGYTTIGIVVPRLHRKRQFMPGDTGATGFIIYVRVCGGGWVVSARVGDVDEHPASSQWSGCAFLHFFSQAN